MADLAKVKRNISKMISQGAPEADIDAYVASEGATLEQLQQSASAPTPSPVAPEQPAPAAPTPPSAVVGAFGEGNVGNVPPIVPLDKIPDSFHPVAQEGLNEEQQRLVRAYIPKAKDAADLEAYSRSITGGRVGISNADEIVKDYGRTHRDPTTYGFNLNPATKTMAPEPGPYDETPEQASVDATTHDVNYYADQVRRGLFDVLDLPADVLELMSRNNRMGVQTLHLPRWSHLGTVLNEATDDKLAKRDGSIPKPRNALQRYAGATTRLAPGFVAGGGVAGGVRGAVGGLAAATASGVTGEAAADVAPSLGVDPDTARIVGQVVGGGAAGAKALVTGDFRAAAKAARMAKDPRAPFMAEIADDMVRMAEEHAPKKGVIPKGRGPVTVQQINGLEQEYLGRFEDKLNALDIPAVEKSRIKDALRARKTISADDLAKLPPGVAGDAARLGIQKVQTLRDMTPPYGGSNVGPVGKAWNGLIEAGQYLPGNPIPAKLQNFLKIRPGDVNASRLDSARKIVKARKAYEKLGEQVGPSGQREAQAAFNADYEATIAAKAQPKAASGPRRSPEDLAVENNLSQGLKGSWGSTDGYARILGVNRDDILSALDRVKLDDLNPFEIAKLRNGFPVKKTVQPALIPRLEKLLREDGTVARRAGETQATQARKADAAKPKTAAPSAPPAPEPAAPPTSGDFRRVARPAAHAEGKERIIASQERRRDDMFREDSPLSQEILRATNDDVNHVIHQSRTAEEAMRHWDEEVVPRLQREGEFTPLEIKDVRPFIERIANEKRYRTDAEFEKGTKVGPRGRPKKQPEQPDLSTDDVPF